MEPYILVKIEYPGPGGGNHFKQLKKLSGQRTRFTIRELIKIF
jgi:hypothetical protein